MNSKIFTMALLLLSLGSLSAEKLKIKFVFSKAPGFASAIQSLKTHLEKTTGFEVETSVAQPGAYIEVIESLGSGEADVAFINTFGYLLAHDLYGSQAIVQVLRGNNNAAYQGQIIAHKDNGITDLKDLQGKKFGFMNQYSSTGYILPDAMLKKEKIKTFNTHYDSYTTLLEDLYQKKIDAGATFYRPENDEKGIQDARKLLLGKYPDIAEKLVIVAKTEKLLNEPVVVRSNFDKEKRKTLTEALLAYASKPESKQSLDSLYNISGFREIDDDSYKVSREFIISSGREVADVVPGAAGLIVKEYKKKQSTGITSSQGPSELHQAVKKADISKLKELIAKQDINSLDTSGNTPLHVAAATRFWGPDYWLPYRTVKFLISNGAKVNVRNAQGKTAADLAKLNGNTEIVKLLKKNGG